VLLAVSICQPPSKKFYFIIARYFILSTDCKAYFAPQAWRLAHRVGIATFSFASVTLDPLCENSAYILWKVCYSSMYLGASPIVFFAWRLTRCVRIALLSFERCAIPRCTWVHPPLFLCVTLDPLCENSTFLLWKVCYSSMYLSASPIVYFAGGLAHRVGTGTVFLRMNLLALCLSLSDLAFV